MFSVIKNYLYNIMAPIKVDNKFSAITYCPVCGDIHQGQSNLYIYPVEVGIYQYTCTECGNVSEFNYIDAPVPICTCDNVIERTLRRQSKSYHVILDRISTADSYIKSENISESMFIEQIQSAARKAIENHDDC